MMKIPGTFNGPYHLDDLLPGITAPGNVRIYQSGQKLGKTDPLYPDPAWQVHEKEYYCL